MTFLELCQRLRAECQDLGVGPVAVTGQTGKMLGYVNAIQESWLKLQMGRNDWTWLQGATPTPLQTLKADNDEPFIAPELHMVIVWAALRGLSTTLAATEMMLRAENEFATYHDLLCKRYVAKLTFGSGDAW